MNFFLMNLRNATNNRTPLSLWHLMTIMTCYLTWPHIKQISHLTFEYSDLLCGYVSVVDMIVSIFGVVSRYSIFTILRIFWKQYYDWDVWEKWALAWCMTSTECGAKRSISRSDKNILPVWVLPRQIQRYVQNC